MKRIDELKAKDPQQCWNEVNNLLPGKPRQIPLRPHKFIKLFYRIAAANFRKWQKKKLKFRKLYFYFFRRRGFIHFKVKKNENCFFLTVPMQ